MTKSTRLGVSEIEVIYKPAIGRKPIISSSYDAYVEIKEFYNPNTIALQEEFVCMFLNRCNRVLGVYPLSLGGITGSVADIRIILGIALKIAATGLIVSHNHPSGNLSPSKADKDLTGKIKECCTMMELKLLDHIVISPEGSFYSFADEGML